VPALWATTYGRLLCVKVAAVLVVLMVASRSRRFVRGLAPEPEPDQSDQYPGGVLTATRTGTPAPTLHRLVRTELAICVAVLGITSVLVSTAPGRDTYVQPYEGSMAMAGGSAAVSVNPARVGANTVRVTLSVAGGGAMEPREVGATLTLPSAGIGPLPVALVRVGPGSYTAASVPLPRDGKWTLNLRVRTSEFDATVSSVQVPVR
jgi:copper transport protein